MMDISDHKCLQKPRENLWKSRRLGWRDFHKSSRDLRVEDHLIIVIDIATCHGITVVYNSMFIPMPVRSCMLMRGQLESFPILRALRN